MDEDNSAVYAQMDRVRANVDTMRQQRMSVLNRSTSLNGKLTDAKLQKSIDDATRNLTSDGRRGSGVSVPTRQVGNENHGWTEYYVDGRWTMHYTPPEEADYDTGRTSIRDGMDRNDTRRSDSSRLTSIAQLEQNVRELERQLREARAGEWEDVWAPSPYEGGHGQKIGRRKRVDHDKVARLRRELREAETRLANARRNNGGDAGGGTPGVRPPSSNPVKPGLGRDGDRIASGMGAVANATVGPRESLGSGQPSFKVNIKLKGGPGEGKPDAPIMYAPSPPPGWNEGGSVPWTFPPQPWAAWPVTDANGKVWALDPDGFYEEFDSQAEYNAYMREEKVKPPDLFSDLPDYDFNDPASLKSLEIDADEAFDSTSAYARELTQASRDRLEQLQNANKVEIPKLSDQELLELMGLDRPGDSSAASDDAAPGTVTDKQINELLDNWPEP